MNVLDELMESDDRIDRLYVERRLDDWRRRVVRLYADVSRWLPEGWTATDGGSVAMREELMQRFDLPAFSMPTLSLSRDGTPVGQLEPRGLWIIGANGRVDLILRNDHYLLTDRSDSFEDPAWSVASIDSRRDEKPLSRELVGALLK